MAQHTCLCWMGGVEVHMGPDPFRPGTWRCLSCGAPDSEVFAIQREYTEACLRGEEKVFAQRLLTGQNRGAAAAAGIGSPPLVPAAAYRVRGAE